MDKSVFLERMGVLLKEGDTLTQNSVRLKDSDPLRLDLKHYGQCNSWRLSCLNLLRCFAGDEHHFYKDFQTRLTFTTTGKVELPVEFTMEEMIMSYSTLRYIKREVEVGLFEDIQHLHEANLFSNLLEQAFELLEKKYLVGSAVYCRLIIENYIKDMCRIKEVHLEGTDRLPHKLTKLRKQNVIDLPLERLIQAQYDIGTYAVHGMKEFEKYTERDIKEMLITTRDKILTIK